MRTALIAVPLAFLASPAFAQSASPAQRTTLQLPPDTADRIADALQSLSETVHDLAGPTDKRAQDIQRRIADAKPKIEQSVKAINQALPEITANLQSAQKSIERAIANMPDPNYPRR